MLLNKHNDKYKIGFWLHYGTRCYEGNLFMWELFRGIASGRNKKTQTLSTERGKYKVIFGVKKIRREEDKRFIDTHLFIKKVYKLTSPNNKCN